MNNIYFCYSGLDGFGMGSDEHFGLYVSAELKTGQTHPCRTFNNEPLCNSGDEFIISDIEIWGFNI